MHSVTLDPLLLGNLSGKTAVVTGAAGGIGAEIVRLFVSNGANVAVADLAHARDAAESLIASLSEPSRAVFIPTNILDWSQMTTLFKQTKERFGSIEVVIANAGVMESETVMDLDNVGEDGELLEAREYSRVIDINLKGTMSTIRQGLFYMKDNDPCFQDGSRGAIILISSTSGYFGGTGVTGYVSSKHGVIGLLRSSQAVANKYSVRINGVAPFVTPTNMAARFTDEWRKTGLPINTKQAVANVVANLAADSSQKGSCYFTCGPILREMEHTRKSRIEDWLGEDAAHLMNAASKFFEDRGGYPLPNLEAMRKL